MRNAEVGMRKGPTLIPPRVAAHRAGTPFCLRILNKNLIIDQGGINPCVGNKIPTRVALEWAGSFSASVSSIITIFISSRYGLAISFIWHAIR